MAGAARLSVRSLLMLLLLTAVTGVLYPVVIAGLGRLAFGDEARGSFVHHDGRIVGSSLIGQRFEGARWFHGRPSAVSYLDGADTLSSGGSNLGPNSAALATAVRQAGQAVADANGVELAAVPTDLATMSASGLDPHISVEAAQLQAPRVAAARRLPPPTVERLVDEATSAPTFGFLGARRVNVLQLNLALERSR